MTEPFVRSTFGGGALGDDLAAVLAGARAHVDEPVGAVRIICSSCSTTTTVFPRSRSRFGVCDQLVVVALMQADRGLVEDVEDADELAADLRREAEPLCPSPPDRVAAARSRLR